MTGLRSRVSTWKRELRPGSACGAVLVASVCAVLAGSTTVGAQDIGTDAQRDSGKTLYMKYCSQCHGEKGDGEGYAAPHLFPRPRNFTTGKFKIRTTPNGALPTHQDIVNIIRHGMPYTSMPAWPAFSDQEVSNLAYFITTFSPDFSSKEKVPQTVPLPSAPASSKESIEAGKKAYVDTGCVRCHGNLGRGDGPSAPTLKDDWDHPIRTADLSQNWTFRGGPTREDIFRTLSTGLNGTPMPSFADSLTPEQRWAIADYITSLSGTNGPAYANLVVAKHVDEPVDLSKGAASFATAVAARFPIVGQITEPVREFHPPATSVTVQAIHDGESIAVLVRWHDRTAEKSGTNGPTLAVPVEEEEEPAPAGGGAGAAPDASNPFGDAEVQQKPAAQAQNPFEEAEAPAAAASEFSDAVSVQIPSQNLTGPRKPYFIFGDNQNSVDLWFFDLAKSAPNQFVGKGSADVAANETGDVTGVARYEDGEWSVIFKRPLRPDAGAKFAAGEFMPVAFSVWDGFSRERGSRRGLTLWYSLYVEPDEVPSPIGPMIRTALFILVFELAVIGLVRRRTRGREPATSG